MDIKKATTIEKIIDAIGILFFTIAFIVWRINDSAVNIAGTLAALLALLLFTIICMCFVHKWMALWSNETSLEYGDNIINKDDKKTVLTLIVGFMIYDFVILLIIHAIRVFVFKDTTTFLEGLELFLWIDTGYYLEIANGWYTALPEIIYRLVFYPGYPVLIRAVNIFVHNTLYSAVILSGIMYGLSAGLLYSYLRLDYSRESALRGIKYFAILPATFFFAAPMSESLFYFLTLATLYLVRKEKWLLACICGAYCSFTRSLGVLVIVPIIYNCITGVIKDEQNRSKWIRRTIYSFTIVLGTVAYLYINYRTTGNWFSFSGLEKEKWGQSMGWFFDSIALETDNALSVIQLPFYTHALGLWFPNAGYNLGVLVVMAIASKKMKPGYILWFMCYYFLAIGVTYLISGPRYLIAFFPFLLAIIELTEKKKVDQIFSILSIVFGAYYLFAFAARWEVF